MNPQPVFLLSYGRTGSTWLQRLLNLHPKLTIWGEHYGFLEGIAEAWATFRSLHGSIGKLAGDRETTAGIVGPLRDPDAPVAWWAPWTPGELADRFRAFLGGLFAADLPEDVRWGFKEIRYETPRVPLLLGTFFPEARFLLLGRDEAPCLRSMVLAWWMPAEPDADDAALRRFVDHQRDRIRRCREAWRALAATHPDRVMKVRYEDLRDRFDETVGAAFAFIGERLDPIPGELWEHVRRTRGNATSGDPALVARIDRVVREACGG